MAKKFSIVSLGCPKNLVDSENMVKQLQACGYQLIPENNGEDLVILNTCAFLQSAIKEAEENIKELLKLKKSNKVKNLVVTGCFPTRSTKDELKKKFPEVDLWLSIKEEKDVSIKIGELLKSDYTEPNDSEENIFQVKMNPSYYAYLKISEGCNNHCAYCVIPSIRGKYYSRPLIDILEEAKVKLLEGAKELVLVAEDTTVWGSDLFGKPSLSLLVQELSKLDVAWIRILYAYPSKIDNALIREIRKRKNICNYLDIPLQHISNNILKSMNRHYTKEDVCNLFKKLKKKVPDIAIRTSFIIGFPGETEADFEELLDFINEYDVDNLGCFAYSAEPGTAAYDLDCKIAPEVVEERIDKLMSLQFELIKKRNKRFLNKNHQFIFEGLKEGRLYKDAPEIDSKLIIDNDERLVIGNIYRAKIVDVDGYDLIGQVLK